MNSTPPTEPAWQALYDLSADLDRACIGFLSPATVMTMSKSLTLEIPGDVADALRQPDLEKVQRLRLELAVSLYSQGILGLGKTAQLANLARWEMNRVLTQRKVPMRYGPEELAEDLQYGRGDQ
jgi:predicted HTH domain antitoxin